MSHTPGPWRQDGSYVNGRKILGAGGVRIATLSHVADKPIDQKAADASLIAKAPDLHETLRRIVTKLDANETGWMEYFDLAAELKEAHRLLED